MSRSVWDRFDGVYVLGYTGMRERIVRMNAELSRVGLDKAVVVWNYPSPYDDVIAKGVKMGTHRRYLSPSIGHYRIILTALCLGKRNILVLEDDARFLKDVKEIEKMMTDLPYDYDIAMLDHQVAYEKSEDRINESWSACNDKRVSAAAYSLRESGMRYIAKSYDDAAMGKGEFKCIDQLFDIRKMHLNSKFLIANKNVAVQKNLGANNSGNNMEAIYRKMGINTEDYADA